MADGRNWMARLMLRLPTSIRSFREIPVLGSVLHTLSHRILPSDQKVWAQVEAGPAKGIWLELNPRTGQNYRLGETEKICQAVVAEKLQSGDVFYDLGANLGFFSLLAARIVGPTGKVFSFEPDVQIAERLRRNAGRNGFSNIAVVELGVWSASGTLNFITADSSSPDRGVGDSSRMIIVRTAFQRAACRSMISFGGPLHHALSSVMSKVRKLRHFVELKISYLLIIRGFCVNCILARTLERGGN